MHLLTTVYDRFFNTSIMPRPILLKLRRPLLPLLLPSLLLSEQGAGAVVPEALVAVVPEALVAPGATLAAAERLDATDLLRSGWLRDDVSAL